MVNGELNRSGRASRVEFLTFDCICRPTNLYAIEVSPMPGKELGTWTDFTIVMIGLVPVLTAVCVIFFGA
jgi:hypothetical protein